MAKRQKLLDRENYLLKELQYYEKRIELELNKGPKSIICYVSDDYDSDYEIKVNNEPLFLDLKLEKKKLQTGYLATTELNDITVVQSEINILPDDPILKRELPISEPGVWKECVTECRIGMISFTIHYLTHQSDLLFAPKLFRNLRVSLTKKQQEEELSRSVLSRITCPSHAVKLLRSYENAYRSRRVTLAEIVSKYGNIVSMECMDDGSVMIKCGVTFNFTWFLENKFSYLSPFKHKMTYELEFMDESVLKILKNANKQIQNPSLKTEERTKLLCDIIEACGQDNAVLDSDSNQEIIQPILDKLNAAKDSEKVNKIIKTVAQNTNNDNVTNDQQTINGKLGKSKENTNVGTKNGQSSKRKNANTESNKVPNKGSQIKSKEKVADDVINKENQDKGKHNVKPNVLKKVNQDKGKVNIIDELNKEKLAKSKERVVADVANKEIQSKGKQDVVNKVYSNKDKENVKGDYVRDKINPNKGKETVNDANVVHKVNQDKGKEKVKDANITNKVNPNKGKENVKDDNVVNKVNPNKGRENVKEANVANKNNQVLMNKLAKKRNNDNIDNGQSKKMKIDVVNKKNANKDTTESAKTKKDTKETKMVTPDITSVANKNKTTGNSKVNTEHEFIKPNVTEKSGKNDKTYKLAAHKGKSKIPKKQTANPLAIKVSTMKPPSRVPTKSNKLTNIPVAKRI